ncbi:MAG: UDP-N-acetylmuramoyl-tripeptide--D-alanyl-D-alanine ligase [Anaerococcus sp.]|nr:UDP-N-acetylmuramoyl-tripeptide--D-alanyl-D-alanine ligase [Anaerococcus sp.]
MIERNLGQIATMIGGELSDESYKDIRIKGVSTDSRTIEEGNLYIPLIGEVFDGRIFIKESEDKKAGAFLIDRDYQVKSNISLPYIRVDDTLKALQDLARAYRKELDIKLVAITGSNGKTTTKDILYEVLRQKYKVNKTNGNLNNEIGVPKTILSFDEDIDIGITELGTDSFGDISLTTSIAKPDIAIITNIGDSHLQNLKSKEGIFKAKMEIIEGLAYDGVFIYNGDDETIKKELPSYVLSQKTISFGLGEDVDFKVKEENTLANMVKFSKDGESYQIGLLGKHNIYNGACVLLVAKLFGLTSDEVKRGFANMKPSLNRGHIIEFSGFDVYDDTYKSNPQSLRAGLKSAALVEGYNSKIAVLGDMLELGEREEELHYEVGLDIDPNDFEYCLFLGRLSYHTYKAALNNFPKNRVFYFQNKDELIEKLKSLISKSTLVFVKGSHGMHMNEVVDAISKLKV